MPTAPPEYADAELADIRSLARDLWRRRWWLMVSTMVFFAAFAAVALFTIPAYRASVVLIPAAPDRNNLSGALNSSLGQLGTIAALAGVNVGSADAETEEALAVLRSRDFTEHFIVDLDLLPKMFPSRWDATAGNWRPSAKVPTPGKGVRQFADHLLNVEQNKKTGLVTVSIDWPERLEAPALANELVRRLNEEMRARAIAKADASTKFLEKELTATSVVETREAINRLVESQIKQRMLATVTNEFAFRVVDRATAADRDDTIRPKTALLLTLGVLVGLGFGIALVLVINAFSRPRT